MNKFIPILLSILCLTGCVKYTICYETDGETKRKMVRVCEVPNIYNYSHFSVVKSYFPTEYTLYYDCPESNGTLLNKKIAESNSPIIVKDIYKCIDGKFIKIDYYEVQN